MKRTRIIHDLLDDLDMGEGNPVPATETVHLSYGRAAAGVKTVQLDLTDAHFKELDEFLAPYLRAGRLPEEPPKDAPRYSRRPSTQEQKYMSGMRDFARERGLRFITKTGKYYYSVALRRQYDAYLAEVAQAETEQAEAEADERPAPARQ